MENTDYVDLAKKLLETYAKGKVGEAEAALSMGTGAVAVPASKVSTGVSALAAKIAGKDMTPAQILEEQRRTQEGMTFTPRTEAGQQTLNKFGEALTPLIDPVLKGIKSAGDSAMSAERELYKKLGIEETPVVSPFALGVAETFMDSPVLPGKLVKDASTVGKAAKGTSQLAERVGGELSEVPATKPGITMEEQAAKIKRPSGTQMSGKLRDAVTLDDNILAVKKELESLDDKLSAAGGNSFKSNTEYLDRSKYLKNKLDELKLEREAVVKAEAAASVTKQPEQIELPGSTDWTAGLASKMAKRQKPLPSDLMDRYTKFTGKKGNIKEATDWWVNVGQDIPEVTGARPLGKIELKKVEAPAPEPSLTLNITENTPAAIRNSPEWKYATPAERKRMISQAQISGEHPPEFLPELEKHVGEPTLQRPPTVDDAWKFITSITDDVLKLPEDQQLQFAKETRTVNYDDPIAAAAAYKKAAAKLPGTIEQQAKLAALAKLRSKVEGFGNRAKTDLLKVIDTMSAESVNKLADEVEIMKNSATGLDDSSLQILARKLAQQEIEKAKQFKNPPQQPQAQHKPPKITNLTKEAPTSAADKDFIEQTIARLQSKDVTGIPGPMTASDKLIDLLKGLPETDSDVRIPEARKVVQVGKAPPQMPGKQSVEPQLEPFKRGNTPMSVSDAGKFLEQHPTVWKVKQAGEVNPGDTVLALKTLDPDTSWDDILERIKVDVTKEKAMKELETKLAALRSKFNRKK